MFKLNVFICIVVLLSFGCMYKVAYAGNDLEKWNGEVGRTVRQSHSDKLAQTTYKEISSKNVKVAQDMRTVYPQIETSAQVAGSRTRVVAEAVLQVDKDKVWKDWARKIGKFGKGANAVGGALVVGGLIADAVGWVIDEGGKVTKKDEGSVICADNSCASFEYVWFLNYKSEYYSVPSSSVCIQALGNENWWGKTLFKYTSADKGVCYGSDTDRVLSEFNKVKNPNYISSAPQPERTVVSEAEKEQVLKDLLNNPKYADLAAQMIGNTYSIGSDNPEPDPAVVNDIKNAQKDVLKSDNPKGDGKTRTDPKIDTGTEIKSDSTTNTESTTNVNETTTTNPDGSTTTTGTNVTNNTTITNNTFELPAFCDYASKLCDWLDWTKEEPELVDDKLEIQERDVTDYKYEEHIKFGQSCPFSEKTQNLDMGVGVMKVKYNLDFFCDFSREAKPTIVGIGHLGALIFLLIGIRSGASG